MKVIVSDTSSVSNLIVIGKLSLLKITYGQIIIPPAVYKEIIALEKTGKTLSEFKSASWIEMVAPDLKALQAMMPYQLD